MGNINDIDKDTLIKYYGIDDDNFVAYLNEFKTFKKIIKLGLTRTVPVNKLRELYNKFVYYFSIGHDIKTVVNETIPIIKNLFFYNGNEFLTFTLSNTDILTSNYTSVGVVGRICQIRFGFTAGKQINAGDMIFNYNPAPIFEYRDTIYCNKGNVVVIRINETGIFLNEGTITAGTQVYGETSFIVER